MAKCPQCGDTAHIYGRADVRWNNETSGWDVGDVEELLECTECDESFYYGEAGFDDLPELVLADADLGEAAGDDICTACERPSLDCSRDPCPDVIEDRQTVEA